MVFSNQSVACLQGERARRLEAKLTPSHLRDYTAIAPQLRITHVPVGERITCMLKDLALCARSSVPRSLKVASSTGTILLLAAQEVRGGRVRMGMHERACMHMCVRTYAWVCLVRVRACTCTHAYV